MATEDVALRIALKDEISSGLGSIKNQLLGIGTAWLTWSAAKQVLTGIVNVTSELEKQMARLRGATDRAGLSWINSRREINEFTDRLTESKGVIDDFARESLVRAIDYTKDLGKAMDITSVAADLAAAKDMDLTTATDLLGKAYLGKTEMLGRYGIVVDNTIPKGERFAAVMAEVNKRFGGAAAAEMNTTTEALKRFKDSVGDVGEAIGKQLGGDGGWAKVLDNFSKGFRGLAQAIEKPYDFIQRLDVALLHVIAPATAFRIEMDRLKAAAKEQADEFARLGNGIHTVPEAIKAAMPELDSLEEWLGRVGDRLASEAWAPENFMDISFGIGKVREALEGVNDEEADLLNFGEDLSIITAEAERLAAVLGIQLPFALARVTRQAKVMAIDMGKAFEVGFSAAVDRGINHILDSWDFLRQETNNIWIAMAQDFTRYFVEELLRQVAVKLVTGILKLLQIFDVPENDRFAMSQGADFAKYFTQGMTAGLSGVGQSMTGALAFPNQSQNYMARAAAPSAGLSGGGTVNVYVSGNMTPEFIQKNIVDTIQRAANNGFGGFKYDAGFKTGNSVIAFN